MNFGTCFMLAISKVVKSDEFVKLVSIFLFL